MANLGYGVIEPDVYSDLASVVGITFEDGKTYIIQSLQDVLYCPLATEPTGGGFYCQGLEKVQYTHASGIILYAKPVFKTKATINIGD